MYWDLVIVQDILQLKERSFQDLKKEIVILYFFTCIFNKWFKI